MIIGIVCAHDEEVTLPEVVKSFRKASVPFIAILDQPTSKVRHILQGALETFEMPPGKDEHIYRWGQILELMEWALKRPHGFDWAWRVDADEIWPDIRPAVEKSEEEGCNVINFGICQHTPTTERIGDEQNFIDICPPALEDCSLYLAPYANGYQRAWSLGKNWTHGHGGHSIKRTDAKVMNTDILFDHYPAVDKETLRKKIARKCLEEEKKRGWHVQYQGIKV